MIQKEANFFQSINPNSANFNKANALIFVMLLLLLFSFLIIFILVIGEAILEFSVSLQDADKEKTEYLEERIRHLQDDSLIQRIEMDSLVDASDKFEERADSVLAEKDRLDIVNDSLRDLVLIHQKEALKHKNELVQLQREFNMLKNTSYIPPFLNM